MMDEVIAHIESLNRETGFRALILTGSGKHFSAGADLNWMKSSAKLSRSRNLGEAMRLTAMFEAVANLKVPSIAVAKGSVFGGAVGLVAACDIAFATDDARFCLSEVRLGLIPAVIYPYLARRMRPGQLRRLALTAKVFDAGIAHNAGLIDVVVPAPEIHQVLRTEIELLLNASTKAHGALKDLHKKLAATGFKQGSITAQTIAGIRSTPEAQAGLQAFFDKQPAPWACKLSDDARFLE